MNKTLWLGLVLGGLAVTANGQEAPLKAAIGNPCINGAVPVTMSPILCDVLFVSPGFNRIALVITDVGIKDETPDEDIGIMGETPDDVGIQDETPDEDVGIMGETPD